MHRILLSLRGWFPLIATWNCYISYKNGYAGLSVLHLLPILNPWLIVEMKPVEVFSLGITLVDVHLNWLSWLPFLILKGRQLVILIDCKIFLSSFLDVTRVFLSTVSFHARLDFGILCL